MSKVELTPLQTMIKKANKEQLAADKEFKSIELNSKFNTIKSNKLLIKDINKENNALTYEIVSIVISDLNALQLDYDTADKKVLLKTLKSNYNSKDGGLFTLVCEILINGLTIDYSISLSNYQYINKLINTNRISKTKAKTINSENYSEILSLYRDEDRVAAATKLLNK